MDRQFNIFTTPIEGLKVIERLPVGDGRGYLERIFCARQLSSIGWEKPVAQINHTLTTKRGTVRGLHYQNPPHAEMKLVSCLAGEILDVAVDLRQDSATFLKWHSEKLSSKNCRALLIPEGFAHGFQTLSDNCELLYIHSTVYMPGAEAGLNVNDPRLKILWPLDVTEISLRDSCHQLLSGNFKGVKL